jgi:hypothetical protein
MRFVIRSTCLAVLVALTSTLLLLHPRSESIAAQERADLPVDLALVPADALGFIHVRGADLWKSEILAGFRATFEKAGPKILAALDNKFAPKLSTFDRLTVFALKDNNKDEPAIFGIFRFTKPFEIAEVVTSFLPKALAERIDGKAIYKGEQTPFELYFPDHQHIIVGLSGMLGHYLKHELPKAGPLSNGLKIATAGKPIVVSVNVAGLPIALRELAILPSEVRDLLKAEHATATLDLGATARIDLIAGYKNATDAEAAEQGVKKLTQIGRKELAKLKRDVEKRFFEPKTKNAQSPMELPETLLMVFALGAIDQADELLANPGTLVKRNGAELTASVLVPKDMIVAASGIAAASAGLLIPAVQMVRSTAARAETQNNLKQIALACLNYESAYGYFPHDTTDKDGKPLLSWRVAILPFLEQGNLYNQFKFDEPWDSENNKKWSQVAIKTYMSPNSEPPTPPGMTQYKGFAGPGAMFEPGKKIKILDITDGTSNTILVVEAGEPIPWAKPEDIPYDPKKPLPKLALLGVQDFLNVALCDGSTRTLNMKKLTENTLRNAITRNDGNPLGSDW